MVCDHFVITIGDPFRLNTLWVHQFDPCFCVVKHFLRSKECRGGFEQSSCKNSWFFSCEGADRGIGAYWSKSPPDWTRSS